VETFSDWQKLGNDIHGISADPQFVSSTDFHLSPTSPCINRGAVLDALYAVDHDGQVRPLSTPFDLGAFATGKRTTGVQDNPVPKAIHAPLSSVGANSRVFDLNGRLVGSAADNNAAGRSRMLVIVPKGKQAFVRSEVKR
jgi:hypothetical protein